MASEIVRKLIDDAVEEYSQYLEMFVGAFLAQHDADLDEVELIIDTYDSQRVVMYPRLKAANKHEAHVPEQIFRRQFLARQDESQDPEVTYAHAHWQPSRQRLEYE